MKRIIAILLCLLMIASFASCKKKTDDKLPPVEIPATDTTETAPPVEVPADNSADEFEKKHSAEEDEPYINYETKNEDFRSERERVEIENELKSAEELVADECYEDAMEIIKVLKTRKLSLEENKRLEELQKKMLEVSN